MNVKSNNDRLDEYKEIDKAMNAYVQSISDVSMIQDDAAVYGFADFFQNKIHIIRAIRSGLPYHLFDLIKSITPFSELDWAQYLNISVKSLHRYRDDINFLFKPIHTEKIIELAEVTLFGQEVFDTKRQFYTWLNTPCYALGQLKPADLLRDSYGKEMVMAELNRIEYGIFV